MALGVPGRLRPWIFSTFGTTRVVGHQPNAPAAITPGEIPGSHFERLSRPQGTWVCQKEPRKKSQVTPSGIEPGTVRLVGQRLNHYATPGPNKCVYTFKSILYHKHCRPPTCQYFGHTRVHPQGGFYRGYTVEAAYYDHFGTCAF